MKIFHLSKNLILENFLFLSIKINKIRISKINVNQAFIINNQKAINKIVTSRKILFWGKSKNQIKNQVS